MNKTKNLNFSQIESERRKTLELILVVLCLGFLLNIGASVLVNYLFLQPPNWLNVTIYLFLLLILVTIILRSLLYPGKVKTNIPVVILFDTKLDTISIPTQIHFPPSNRKNFMELDIFSFLIPFPVSTRLTFDTYKNNNNISRIDKNDFSKFADLMKSLVEYEFFNHYTKENDISWAAKNRIHTGPFETANFPSLPSTVYSGTDLASITGNTFFNTNPNEFSLRLPDKTRCEYKSPHNIYFYNPLFKVDVKLFLHATQHLEAWKYANGSISSWYRELSSDYNETIAMLFEIQIDFQPRISFWRFFPEIWIPNRFRPKVSLHDIYSWMDSWINSASFYFDWVDEDFSSLSDKEISILVDRSTTTYKPKGKGTTPVTFQSR